MMATIDEWSVGYARQASADFNTFDLMQELDVPDCHKLQFLQMACEKLAKAHRCGTGTLPEALQSSHAQVAAHLPVVLRQQAVFVNFGGPQAREVLARASTLAQGDRIARSGGQAWRTKAG